MFAELSRCCLFPDNLCLIMVNCSCRTSVLAQPVSDTFPINLPAAAIPGVHTFPLQVRPSSKFQSEVSEFQVIAVHDRQLGEPHSNPYHRDHSAIPYWVNLSLISDRLFINLADRWLIWDLLKVPRHRRKRLVKRKYGGENMHSRSNYKAYNRVAEISVFPAVISSSDRISQYHNHDSTSISDAAFTVGATTADDDGHIFPVRRSISSPSCGITYLPHSLRAEPVAQTWPCEPHACRFTW